MTAETRYVAGFVLEADALRGALAPLDQSPGPKRSVLPWLDLPRPWGSKRETLRRRGGEMIPYRLPTLMDVEPL